ncbi:MAG: DinB family protein [Actinomycetota bacterium]
MTDRWVTPAVERTEPPFILGEREGLEAWLDYHRETLLWKCSGLTAEQLKQRAAPPSTLSLLGLVRHLTEVERWWFSIHAGNTDMPMPHSTPDNEMADFDDLAEADAEADFETYRREIERSRAAVRDKQLDDVVPSHGRHKDRVRNVRWIYLHMIEEYARHNGHADIIREQLDGATGD